MLAKLRTLAAPHERAILYTAIGIDVLAILIVIFGR